LSLSCRGKKDESKSYKEYEKEEMFRAQQELLEARRSGKALDNANQRRKQVAVREFGRKNKCLLLLGALLSSHDCSCKTC
jgi:hypothetical protein